MDTLRGNFPTTADDYGADGYYDAVEEDTGHEVPPSPVGQDERRMQVRAYNYWANLLTDRNFPSIEDLDPENLPDFGPYSVLLDFSSGIENPGISYLGDMLATECGADGEIHSLDDVPSRSLLSRITDHYMQILANQAPIGFEAEFVNQYGRTILYRGILLPFSSDDDTIDFIYGVINWKELADQFTTDELMLEIDQALDDGDGDANGTPSAPALETPLADWADSPLAESEDEVEGEELTASVDNSDVALDLAAFQARFASTGSFDEEDEEYEDEDDDGVLDLSASMRADAGEDDDEDDDGDLPRPGFGLGLTPMDRPASTPVAKKQALPPIDYDTDDYAHVEAAEPEYALTDGDDANGATEIAFDFPADGEMELGDWLASARELAQAAHNSEDRTRQALYAAIGHAYDFSLAAADAPAEFDELLADAGLTVQDRAPMTPVVKLVFGAEYDKTRLTEYAAALTHGHRLGIGRGELTEFLSRHEGGLKGVVQAERRLRREESGKPLEPVGCPREHIARKLRKLDAMAFEDLAVDGAEFALLMVRRLPDGTMALLGEVPDDVTLLERAARKLIG